jgi:predicted O-methyltransferase YrrM
MRLQGSAEQITEHISQLHAGAGAALERARARVKKTKREIEPFQAAAMYALTKPYNFEGAQILEIGTAYGYSSAVMAEAAPLAKITTLNPQAHEVEAARAALIDYPNVQVIQEKSWDYLSTVKDKGFDLIFIDGDHKRVKADIPFWELLNPGGLLLFHDYAPAGSRRECPPVYEAVNEFAESLGRDLDVLVMDDDQIGLAGFYMLGSVPVDVEMSGKLATVSTYSLNSYTHLTQIYTLAQRYQGQSGAIVECGVSRGGSAGALLAGAGARATLLFDTFDGMPEPGPRDEAVIHDKWGKRNRGRDWCRGEMEDVWKMVKAADLPADDIRLHPGMFHTEFNRCPSMDVAILHIDATLFESTFLALAHWYPQVKSGGLVIVSAYNYWTGIKAAVDRYLQQQGERPLMQPFDKSHVWWTK